MNAQQLENWILNHYQGLIVKNAYAERSVFYNPELSLPKGIYFATIKERNGPNDKASDLDRNGVFRLSFGIGKRQYQNLFGHTPERPEKGGVVKLDTDFTALDTLMPHPIYAWMGWVCINNPEEQQLEKLKFLLGISYENVLTKFDKRK